MSEPTQVRHSWRSTARTIFQAVVGLAVVAPFAYQAATNEEPAQASGLAATGLLIAGAVTRIMAIPGVNSWIEKFLPFLAAQPSPPGDGA